MPFANRVRIARRFQKSIRIDTDISSRHALEGFICPQSSAELLMTLARHVARSGQGAFTWTGPYGSGKFSLAVAVSALLNGDERRRQIAAKIFGQRLAHELWKALPPGTRGWRIVPVVGRRDDPVVVLGEALQNSGLAPRRPRGGWTEKHVIDCLMESASAQPKAHGGVLLLIDEMGKFLERAASDGGDVYLFQQLAEIANRSERRFITIGVLHQAFEEYAHRLSRQMRDEWAKIQGRYVDLPVNPRGDEQIELISRAIETHHTPKRPSDDSRLIASLICRGRDDSSGQLASTLEACWPLHPAVAALLGPISRRRFGQNQRSIFGFLNSSEPYGFQDFLRTGDGRALYGPDLLWDYLRANLEPSILASPDGHRWATAAEALERCEAIGGEHLHIRLVKIIGVIDLFKERSGLVPTLALIRSCLPDVSEGALKTALHQLTAWSFVIFRKFLDGYGIFAGSDFDIDQAVSAALGEVEQIDFAALRTLAGLQAILAKRHYHETGTMRWFDVDILAVKDLISAVQAYRPPNGTIGKFFLALPTQGEGETEIIEACRQAIQYPDTWDAVVGISRRSNQIVEQARELLALGAVSRERPELAGDSVARREIAARFAAVQAQLEAELRRALDSALWLNRISESPNSLRQADLNGLASTLAETRYCECPRLHNELLNRNRPSGNAIAAQNELLRRMVTNEGEERLGIRGFPAEGGLFTSILESTGLYRANDNTWHFMEPSPSGVHRLWPMWNAAIQHLQQSRARAVAVSDLYAIWRRAPFGVKDGLMPVLAVAFIQSLQNHVAVYREGIFRARFDDVDVQYLSKDPSYVQLRWLDLSDTSRRLLSDLADIVRCLDKNLTLVHLEPIDVARGLVSLFENLPWWTKRTMRLSSNAIKVRGLVRRAQDPNQFLFNDIPAALGGTALEDQGTVEHVVVSVHEGLEELVGAYPLMLSHLKDSMLSELQVPNGSPRALAELRERATNITQMAGDFQLDAFAGRLSAFSGNESDFEGIASLAANKPPRDWVDPDVDQAAIALADLCQRFLRAETFARVKGRKEKRQAIAVIIGMNGKPEPLMHEFTVADSDNPSIKHIVREFSAVLGAHEGAIRSEVVLAALAEVGAEYILRSAQRTAEPGEEGEQAHA